jgi:P4 family phage/plasmid primase-like protien
MTTLSSQYNNLSEFLTKHSISHLSANGTHYEITHTRIGSPEMNIYGGSYHIDNEELPLFYKLLHDHVFIKNQKEYLTEKQLTDSGPILVDFDFRYDYSVQTRQHTSEHIDDIVQLYLEILKEFFIFEDNKSIQIFVMEKPNVNRVSNTDESKNVTKDGIHILFGIQMDRTMQLMLREKVIKKIDTIWDLPLINSWDKVIDEGISKGCVNWQLFGCQKPGYQAYKLTQYIVATIDPNDNEFMTVKRNIKEFDYANNISLLSAQYSSHPKFEINPKIQEEYNKIKQNGKRNSRPISNTNSRQRANVILELTSTDENSGDITIDEIDSFAKLEKALNNIFNDLKPCEYDIKETHLYTQILPPKYYEPGSHLLNRQVAFALKHTDERLFLSWIMLRSKASDFDYSTIPRLYNDWNRRFNIKPQDGITKRSIMYWARQDAFEEYEKVKTETVDHFIEETIATNAEYDFANVLFHMFKDKYVCSSIVNKRWYTFKNHRWELDEGNTLRLAISKDMHTIYQDKIDKCLIDLQNYDHGDEAHVKIQSKIKRLSILSIMLKKTNDKNNIMREAMELFYDKEFIKNMDANKYLMCFKNGVVDFKNKIVRQGYPQDYITKTTGIPYCPFDDIKDNEAVGQIENFMVQLFPSAGLNKYMWDHLASCLIGIKKEHAFNIYRGSGSNGKSIVTDLMSQALGDYKGTVPITLVTEKRNNIGGTSSEIIQLKGIRYAVMQEPSKDAVINEGVMKELTGGDPIQARALYCDSEIFEPQFSLVVCTNALFEIKSNDDGTWRRVKLVDFKSKFISDGEEHTDDTPHVFKKDKDLKQKLPKWGPIFASMLVKRAFETEGEVVDCEEVVEASRKYRQNQDHITGFINEKIIKITGKTIGKQGLHAEFKEWFQSTYGNRKMPKLTELDDAMNKKFGNRNAKNKWANVTIRQEEAVDDLEELEE